MSMKVMWKYSRNRIKGFKRCIGWWKIRGRIKWRRWKRCSSWKRSIRIFRMNSGIKTRPMD